MGMLHSDMKDLECEGLREHCESLKKCVNIFDKTIDVSLWCILYELASGVPTYNSLETRQCGYICMYLSI